MVAELMRASRGACTPGTAAELRQAATVLNRADPRFWGGAEGLPDTEVADLIVASIRTHLTAVTDPEVRRYVVAGWQRMHTVGRMSR
ncbi:MAG: hypothetical protein INR66_00355 [Gordonia polyisoprenivorans]|nr:hypothetical protein [Gordonia polyisoprenivorans]